MHGIGRDPARGEAAVKFIGEEEVAEFGSVISQHGPVVAPRRRQAAEVKFPGGVINICKSEEQRAQLGTQKMQLLVGLSGFCLASVQALEI